MLDQLLFFIYFLPLDLVCIVLGLSLFMFYIIDEWDEQRQGILDTGGRIDNSPVYKLQAKVAGFLEDIVDIQILTVQGIHTGMQVYVKGVSWIIRKIKKGLKSLFDTRTEFEAVRDELYLSGQLGTVETKRRNPRLPNMTSVPPPPPPKITILDLNSGAIKSKKVAHRPMTERFKIRRDKTNEENLVAFAMFCKRMKEREGYKTFKGVDIDLLVDLCEETVRYYMDTDESVPDELVWLYIKRPFELERFYKSYRHVLIARVERFSTEPSTSLALLAKAGFSVEEVAQALNFTGNANT